MCGGRMASKFKAEWVMESSGLCFRLSNVSTILLVRGLGGALRTVSETGRASVDEDLASPEAAWTGFHGVMGTM